MLLVWGPRKLIFQELFLSLELGLHPRPDGIAAVRQKLLEKILVQQAEELAKQRMFDSGQRNICTG